MKGSIVFTNSAGSTTIVNGKTQKMQKLNQNNLKKIQQHVATFYSSPQCNGYCSCQICKEKYQLKDKGKQFLRQTSSLIKIDTGRIKTFYKFMASVSKKVSFRLEIPTICFFDKGQCKLMFKSKNQYIMMEQNTQVSKKNIANLFVQAKKKFQQPDLSNHTDNHIRHFSTVVPSYIHGTTQQNSQMKEAKTYFFHTDRRLQNQSFHIVQKSSSQQVAIVKYLDNKGFQLLNQKQLRQLLKTPVNTLCIDFIQSYIKPHEVQSQFYFSQYHSYNPPENPLMWSRSQTQVKLEINLINKYSKQYIPIEHLQSYEEVLKQITQQYILYQTYKMIHYMQLVRNIKVNHFTTVWIKDQFKQISFFGILNFQYDQNQTVQVNYQEAYEIKSIIQKPFNELQNQLLNMWERIKEKKLNQLKNKEQKSSILSKK